MVKTMAVNDANDTPGRFNKISKTKKLQAPSNSSTKKNEVNSNSATSSTQKKGVNTGTYANKANQRLREARKIIKDR